MTDPEATRWQDAELPLAVEKDYWVCEALRAITLSHPGEVIFKGGTSLEKLRIGAPARGGRELGARRSSPPLAVGLSRPEQARA